MYHLADPQRGVCSSEKVGPHHLFAGYYYKGPFQKNHGERKKNPVAANKGGSKIHTVFPRIVSAETILF